MEISQPKTAAISYLPWLLVVIYAVIPLKFLLGYLQFNFILGIGLLILPFTFQFRKQIFSNRYLVPTLLFALLSLILPAQSTIYFSIIFTVLLLFENFIGKTNIAALFILIIVSPLFKFFSDTLGFPLRLWLSKIVAQTMTFVGMKAESAGNIIYIDQYEFYIDQACAGLNMLHVSLLIGIFILSVQQKKQQKTVPLFSYALFFSLIFILNICSNFSRILLIVIFKIMPGTTLHEFVGILSMLIYVILPLFYLSKIFVRYLAKPDLQVTKDFPGNLWSRSSNPALHISLLILLALVLLRPKSPGIANPTVMTTNIPGYKKTALKHEVTKFENSRAIIYFKPTPFYAPEHNPMICWTGSGYEFKFIEKRTIKGIEIYTGILEKGKDKLYSAWWFDNGQVKTIDQLQWRWDSAKGQGPFYLVNVNTGRSADLQKIVTDML
jgi:exosortase N